MSAERLNDEPAHSPYGPSRADGYTGCLATLIKPGGLKFSRCRARIEAIHWAIVYGVLSLRSKYWLKR